MARGATTSAAARSQSTQRRGYGSPTCSSQRGSCIAALLTGSRTHRGMVSLDGRGQQRAVLGEELA
ncbi:hypothetical protein A4X16_13990 [Microbacterium sp. H83]|nr:hypothetical protein A4X16_13990 [Microbacterium sp. H83]